MSRLTSATARTLVAVGKDLDSVWIRFYKEVTPKMKLKFIQIVLMAFICVGCNHKQKIADLTELATEAIDGENYQLAVKDYSEVIRLDPKFAQAYAARGSAFIVLGQFDNAIQDLNKAIQLNPKNYLAYELRGSAYYAKHQLDQAISDLSFALKNNPADDDAPNMRGDAYKLRGLAYYWSRSFTNAIADLTEAAKYLPNDYEIYKIRGDCYDRRIDVNKSLSDFNKAIQLNPDDSVSIYYRGNIYSHTGEYTNAIRDFQRVIQLNTKTIIVRAYNMLAWVLAICPDDNVRDGKKAVALATKACNMSNWTNYAYVDTLAAAYAETGDFEQAVKYQKQATSMNGIPEANRTNVQNRLELYLHHKPYHKVESYRVD